MPQFPNDDPTIRVYFTGLLALHYDQAGKQVKVGIHRFATDHKFSFIIQTLVPGNPIDDFQGLPDIILDDVIGIQVDKPVSPLQAFGTFPPHSLVPSASPIPDPFKLEHAIDLNTIHGGHLQLKSGAAFGHGIFINGGTFYSVDTFSAKVGPSGHAVDHYDISFKIAANIYLKENDPSSSVTLSYLDPKGKQSIEYHNDGSTRYIFYITNGPLQPHHCMSHFFNWYAEFEDSRDSNIQYDVEPNCGPMKHKNPQASKRVIARNNHDNPCNPLFNSGPDPLP